MGEKRPKGVYSVCMAELTHNLSILLGWLVRAEEDGLFFHSPGWVFLFDVFYFLSLLGLPSVGHDCHRGAIKNLSSTLISK